MTVKELREILNNYDENHLVILSSDAEGNKHSPMAEEGEGLYLAETTWHGEMISSDDADDFVEAKPALVFYPVN